MLAGRYVAFLPLILDWIRRTSATDAPGHFFQLQTLASLLSALHLKQRLQPRFDAGEPPYPVDIEVLVETMGLNRSSSGRKRHHN